MIIPMNPLLCDFLFTFSGKNSGYMYVCNSTFEMDDANIGRNVKSYKYYGRQYEVSLEI